jgi:hypothetical protein
MWLDVFLFSTGAFAPGPAYISIMKGTLISRFVVSIFACPFLMMRAYGSRLKNISRTILKQNSPTASALIVHKSFIKI